jgi:hypothetical protein
VGLVDRAERRLSLVNRGQFGAKPAGVGSHIPKPACREQSRCEWLNKTV